MYLTTVAMNAIICERLGAASEKLASEKEFEKKMKKVLDKGFWMC